MKLFNVVKVEADGNSWNVLRGVSEAEAKKEYSIQQFYLSLQPVGPTYRIEEVMK